MSTSHHPTRRLTVALLLATVLVGVIAPVAVAGATELQDDRPTNSAATAGAAVDASLPPVDAWGGDAVSSLAGFGVNSPGVVLLVGYSRHDDSDPLDNAVRKRVYDAVLRLPGAYVVELAEATDVSRSTVRYHVRILEEERLVVGQKIRGRQRMFPADDESPELTAALADDATAPVLDAVARLEPASVSTLAADLDRATSTVSYHLSRLEDAGLVEQAREGCAVRNSLAPDVRADLVRQPVVERAGGGHAATSAE